MRKINPLRSKGLTLIELMITLAVAAIILALAAPGFRTQILNSRTLALTETVSNTLSFARTEALARKGNVSVCGTTNASACNTSDWTQGMLVFVDTAVSDTAASPTVGQILRVVDPFDDQVSIAIANGKSFVRYTGTGALARIDNNPVSMSMHVEGCSGNRAQRLAIALSGSISISKIACPTGG